MNHILKHLLFAAVVVVAVTRATPVTYYVSIGDTAQLQCGGGGSLVCYSTYADKNTQFGMVALTPSYKYQMQAGSVFIMNVQATDAGFYTCASRCDQVTYDQLAYYLQPTMSGVPIDTSQNWIAIPPNAFDDNVNRNRFYVVVSNEGTGYLYGQSGGLSVGEIIGLVVGITLAVLLILIVIIVLCIFNKKRKRRNQDKMISSEKKDEKDTSSVDYSTIERDYTSSAGNTLNSQQQQQLDRDGEMNSLAANKSNANEINTRGMNGPSLYRPSPTLNEYNSSSTRSTGGCGDLPNIDIGYIGDNKKTTSNRSQNRVQFPDTVARSQPIDPRPRYVASNENIHLQQIVQESAIMPNMLDDDFGRNHPYQYNQNVSSDEHDTESGGGGVTVVSARTPVRQDQQLRLPMQPPMQPPPPKAYVNQCQPPPPKQYPGLSLSHRIETTTTPLSVPVSSSSLRNGNAQLLPQSTPLRTAGSINKDGATDV